MPGRTRFHVAESPMAISSQGDVIVGFGYCSSPKERRELIKVISTTKLKPGQSWFVGVVLDQVRRDEVFRRLDDAAAEAAALSGVGAPGPKRKGMGR